MNQRLEAELRFYLVFRIVLDAAQLPPREAAERGKVGGNSSQEIYRIGLYGIHLAHLPAGKR